MSILYIRICINTKMKGADVVTTIHRCTKPLSHASLLSERLHPSENVPRCLSDLYTATVPGGHRVSMIIISL